MDNQPTMTSPGLKNNTLMGILAYMGPLVIISYITAKEVPFVKFHIKQGLVLLVLEIIIWISGMIMYQLWMVWQIINFFVIILAILGIINASQGKEKNLPLVGSYAKHFNI